MNTGCAPGTHGMIELNIPRLGTLRIPKIGLRFAAYWLGFYVVLHGLWRLDLNLKVAFVVPAVVFGTEACVDLLRTGLDATGWARTARLIGRFVFAVLRALLAALPFYLILLVPTHPLPDLRWATAHLPNMHIWLPIILAWNPVGLALGGGIYLLLFKFVANRWLGTLLHGWVVVLCAALFVLLTYENILPNPLAKANANDSFEKRYALDRYPYESFRYPKGFHVKRHRDWFRHPRMIHVLPGGSRVLTAFGSTNEPDSGGLILFDLDRRTAQPILQDVSVKRFLVTRAQDAVVAAETGLGRIVEISVPGGLNAEPVVFEKRTVVQLAHRYYEPLDLIFTEAEQKVVFILDQWPFVYRYDRTSGQWDKIYSMIDSGLDKIGSGFYRLFQSEQRGEFFVVAYGARADVLVFDAATYRLVRSFALPGQYLSYLLPLSADRALVFSHNRSARYLISLDDGAVLKKVRADRSVRAVCRWGEGLITHSFSTGKLKRYGNVLDRKVADAMFVGYGSSQGMTLHGDALYISARSELIRIDLAGGSSGK